MLKTRLVEVSGVSARSLTGYEAGEIGPSETAVQRLAEALKFPLEFFSGPDIDELLPDTASFRALSKMSTGDRNQALTAGALAVEVSDWIGKRFRLPPCDLPDLREFTAAQRQKGGPFAAEAAADALRSLWNLGEQPIGNMIHLLEEKGVRVFSLSESIGSDVDAFSLWKAGTPYVFLNTLKSGERGRFDAAHELGHLVLHAHGGGGREAEIEANRFASAFLLPRSSIVARAPRPATLDQLLVAKRNWNVSAAALAHRMHSLQLVTDWHYRTLCIQMAPFRKEEPNGIPRETSQLLDKVFAALREDGGGKTTIARDLLIHPDEIDALVFGLVMTPVKGGIPSDAPARHRGGETSKLRLVD
jgi:Zn-dependent peptidase ImmA (M78 family)